MILGVIGLVHSLFAMDLFFFLLMHLRIGIIVRQKKKNVYFWLFGDRISRNFFVFLLFNFSGF